MDTISNGHHPKWQHPEWHNPKWMQFQIDTILNGHPSRMETHPEWTQSRMDTVPNGHNLKWHNPKQTPS